MLGAQDIDTVQEVQILTANYNAEYGRSSGGQIRFVTKSGTRNFHGDLVENFRNSWLDAKTWTRNHSPNRDQSQGPEPFRFNQYGRGIAYTFSRSEDNGSSLTDVLPNSNEDRTYWGLSDFDRTHVLIANYIYELAFKGASSWTRRLLGKWEVSGIYQVQTGTPFSVRMNVDYAGVGAGSGNQFWNVTGSTSAKVTRFTDSAVWFNKAAFAQPAPGTCSAQNNRNILRQPGFWSWDMGLRKNFPTFEHQLLQLRWEVFNILNHPNWGSPNANPTSASFGLVTSKTGNRVQQIALK